MCTDWNLYNRQCYEPEWTFVLFMIIYYYFFLLPGGFFLLERCCLCKVVRRHANYRVQRMGIMMTALGSRWSQKAGIAWQLSMGDSCSCWGGACRRGQSFKEKSIIWSVCTTKQVLQLFFFIINQKTSYLCAHWHSMSAENLDLEAIISQLF